MLVPVLMYGIETVLWKEKGKSTIRPVQVDNLIGVLCIRRMDRVLNAQIRELWGMKKDLHERIDEGVLRWFSHVERMERGRIAKKVYVEEFTGSRSVGKQRNRWIDTVKVVKEETVRCQASKDNGPE